MPPAFLTAPGESVPVEDMVCAKALDLANRLTRGSLAYASMLETRRTDDCEVVVFDVEVEIPQLRVNLIQRSERIAVEFDKTDARMPEVLALRQDFPIVPHLNVRRKELPRSLCLYDEPYSELKLRWTSAAFVERIREWLARTAQGRLHQEDQPLEPLFLSSIGEIVVPWDILALGEGASPGRLIARLVSKENETGFLVAEKWSPDHNTAPSEGIPFIATVVVCAPQEHGVIRGAPETLQDLHEMSLAIGLDLVGVLRERFREWQTERSTHDARFILIMAFPKTRTASGPVEAHDIWTFVTDRPLKDVAEAIDAWQIINGERGHVLDHDEPKTGKEISLVILNTHFSLSRPLAAHLNGVEEPLNEKVVAVGLGALGSQVFMNLLRAGVGRWTLVDHDRLLPHNLARHELPACATGMPKVDALARLADGLFCGEEAPKCIIADVLKPGANAQSLSAAFAEAGLILDMSASAAVGRHLALGLEASARRASVFLSPTGSDLVIFMEDDQRQFQLDALEMQFYRALVLSPELIDFFPPPQGRIRYGRSCRDVTTVLPQSQVALCAGIAAHALTQLLREDTASIAIWRSDPDNMTVASVRISPTKPVSSQHGEWRLVVDEQTLAKLSDIRAQRLPNETGGVLVGAFDLQYRIVYVVDALSSPPDSEEWPTLYIRGCHGLKPRLDEVTATTQGALEYVGEWHSHPDGCTVDPSRDDRTVFAWLTEKMDSAGLPALMFIIGEAGKFGRYLGKIVHDKDV